MGAAFFPLPYGLITVAELRQQYYQFTCRDGVSYIISHEGVMNQLDSSFPSPLIWSLSILIVWLVTSIIISLSFVTSRHEFQIQSKLHETKNTYYRKYAGCLCMIYDLPFPLPSFTLSNHDSTCLWLSSVSVIRFVWTTHVTVTVCVCGWNTSACLQFLRIKFGSLPLLFPSSLCVIWVMIDG